MVRRSIAVDGCLEGRSIGNMSILDLSRTSKVECTSVQNSSDFKKTLVQSLL